MNFRIARNVTKREYFEFEAADAEAARAAVHELNRKITDGEDYDVEDPDEFNGVLVDEKDVSGDDTFTLVG